MLLRTLGGTCFAEAANVEFRVLRNGVINDTGAGAVAPSGNAFERRGFRTSKITMMASLDEGRSFNLL